MVMDQQRFGSRPVSKSSRDRVEFNAQTALAAGLARTRAAGHHQHQAKLVEELEIGVVVHVQTGTCWWRLESNIDRQMKVANCLLQTKQKIFFWIT